MILKHGVRLVGFGLLLVLALVGGFIRSNVAEPSREYLDSGVVDVVFRQNRVIDVDPYDRFWLTVSPELEVDSVQVAWDGIANRVLLRKGEMLPVQYEVPGTYQIRVWQANGVELTPFTVRVIEPIGEVPAPKGRGASAAPASGDVQTMDACTAFPGFAVGRVYAGAYANNTIDKYPIRIVSTGAGCCTLTKYGGGWTKTYTFDSAGEQSDVVDVPVGETWTLTKSGGGTATLSPSLPGRLSIDNLILTNGPTYAPVGETVTNRVWKLEGGDEAVLFALPGPYWVTNTPANVGSVFEWTTNGVGYVPFNGFTNIFFGSTFTNLTEIIVSCRSPDTLKTNQWTWIEGADMSVGANTQDRNGNDVEDYADGYSGCGGQGCGSSSSGVDGMFFRKWQVSLTGFNASDPSATVMIHYPASNPSQIDGETIFTCSGTHMIRTPAPGDLRIWTKDGTVVRNADSAASGGDYMPDYVVVPLSSLTNNIVDGRLEFYIEGIRENGGAPLEVTLATATTSTTRSFTVKVYEVQIALFSLLQELGTQPQDPLSHVYQGISNEKAGYLKVRKPANGLTEPIEISFQMQANEQDACYGTSQRPKLYIGGNVVHDFNNSAVYTLDPGTMSGPPGTYNTFVIHIPAPVNGTFVAMQQSSIDTGGLSVELPPQPPSISLAGKFRRVNRQGVPLPDPGPTGEGEDDRLPNQAHIDMFSLTASYSVSDFALPLEGGELTLEFRRTATLQSRDASPNAKPQYVSEDVLGPAWNTALGSRVITSLSELGPTATVIDDLGNSYRYYKSGVKWEPDMRHSFSNDALRCTLENTTNPDELLFKRTHGTKLLFKAVEAGITFCTAETYYRLEEVKDRNDNTIDYIYLADESGLLVSAIKEIRPAMNSARRIEFDYTEANGKIRLTKLTDPLNREITYVYDANNDYLMEVHYPQVLAGVPKVKFTYFETPPNNRVTYVGDTQLCTGSDQQTRWVAVATVTDARNHVTTYTYANNGAFEKVPVSLRADGVIIYESKPVLKQVSTEDGVASFSWGAGNNGTNIVNTVTDAKTNVVQYEFKGSVINAPTLIGKTAVITTVKRTHGGIGSVEFTYSDDGYDNLLSVKDISNNIINYEYGALNTVTNKLFNLVSEKTVVAGGLNLKTKYEYEPKFNKMSKMTDAHNVVTQYEFDPNGNRETVFEAFDTADARTTRYVYSGKGFLTKQTLEDIQGNRVTNFTANDWGDVLTTTVYAGYGEGGQALTTRTDRDIMGRVLTLTPPKGPGSQITYGYDNLDRKTIETHPAAGSTPSTSTQFEYDLNGNLTKVEDDNKTGGYSGGNQTKTMTYDGLNRLLSTTINMGTGPNIVTSKTYDPVGNVETETDGNNKTITYEYDAMLRLTLKTFPGVDTGVHTESYTYGANSGSGAFTLAGFQPTSISNKRGKTTINTYDNAYRLIQSTRDGGASVQYTYNGVHKKTSETVSNDGTGGNQTTGYGLDSLYRVKTVTSPLGLVTQTTYDHADHVLTVTDPAGKTTTNFFDGAGRLTKTVMPAADGHVPTIDTTYDEHSNKETVKDARGSITRFDYDSRDRLTKTTVDEGGLNIVTETQYDYMNNVVKVIDPRTNATDTKYDNAYRAIEIKSPPVPGGVAIVTMQYDGNSNITHLTDPSTNITFTVYDAWNRPSSVTKAFGTPDAITTTTAYDPNNNVTTITLQNNANGGAQTTTYTYDLLDRKTSELLPSPDGQVRQTVWTYYLNGTVRTVTDPKGQITENYYDLDNRLIEARSISDLAETRTFGYNNLNKPLTATDRNGTTTFAYHENDLWLHTETRLTPGQTNYTVTSHYDANGNRTQCVYPGTSRTLVSEYDAANRLKTITDGANITTYGYDKNGNRTSCTLPNDVVTTSVFDTLNRVTSMVNQKGGTTIYSVAYTYDLVGNRLTINETVKKSSPGSTTRNLTYIYDKQYRLTDEQWMDGSKLQQYTYQYDLAGNRTNLVVRDGNTVTTSVFTYDVLNRLNTKTTGNRTTTYSYDLNGNCSSKVGDHASLPKHYYTFDTLNRLVQTRDGSTNGPVIFSATYDYRTRRLTTTEAGSTKYFRYDGGDSFHEVANGTGTIQVEFVRGSGMGGGIGSILYSDRGATREHFTYNAVGHTVALTRPNGSVAKSDLYEAFGNIVASTGSSSNNRLANTKERSFTLGLDNHGFRYFDPEIGRYISRDPIGYGDGLNVYLYVHNNPINHIDPLGLGPIAWVASLIYGKEGGEEFESSIGESMIATGDEWKGGAQVVRDEGVEGAHGLLVEESSDRYANVMINQGEGAMFVVAANDITGATPLLESVYGVDVADERMLSTEERQQRALMGGGQMVLTTVGAANTVSSMKAGYAGTGITRLDAALNRTASARTEALGQGLVEGGACFVAGTKVATSNGYKPIETIDVGDRVWAYDIASGAESLSTVRQIFTRSTDELIVIRVEGESVSSTPEHPFWVCDRGWTPANELAVGDCLKLLNGIEITIEGIDWVAGHVTVYNFEVADYHTYYVGEEKILVHNACTQSTTTTSGKLRPHPSAEGAHTTFKIDPQTGKVTHYETWQPQTNPRNPAPWQSTKRYDATGAAHFNKATKVDVATPHVHDSSTPGGVRTPLPEEMPK